MGGGTGPTIAGTDMPGRLERRDWKPIVGSMRLMGDVVNCRRDLRHEGLPKFVAYVAFQAGSYLGAAAVIGIGALKVAELYAFAADKFF